MAILSLVISITAMHCEEPCIHLCEHKTIQILCATSIYSIIVSTPIVYLSLQRQAQGNGLHRSWEPARDHVGKESKGSNYPCSERGITVSG